MGELSEREIQVFRNCAAVYEVGSPLEGFLPHADEAYALCCRLGMRVHVMSDVWCMFMRFTPESYAMWQLVRSEYENPEV